ncbi:MAG: hypothetical protein IKE22_04985, partial [Atopobiaceae bacterium]|nr:hypothetical protein [Atopobiaceae bacterium]
DWFHEFAHNIDNLCGPRRHAYFSREWRGGLFGDTIKDEVEECCRQRLRALPRVFTEMAIEGRYDELFDDGYGPIDLDTCIKARCGVYSWQDVVARLDRPSMEMAYRSLSKELLSLPKEARADVSDLFGGATNNAVDGGFGHDEPGYWTSLPGTQRLASEGFAEMFSATMTQGESLEALRRCLPRSYSLFKQMLGEMVAL